MPDNALFDPEKLTLIEFKMVKAQLDTPEDFEAEEALGNHIEQSLQLGYHLGDKLAKADFKISIDSKSEGNNKQEAKGYFHLVFIYQIENLEELVMPVKKKLKVNPALAISLASLTYSTSRGILLTRLQGTVFHHFVLPIVNPVKLIKT